MPWAADPPVGHYAFGDLLLVVQQNRQIVAMPAGLDQRQAAVLIIRKAFVTGGDIMLSFRRVHDDTV